MQDQRFCYRLVGSFILVAVGASAPAVLFSDLLIALVVALPLALFLGRKFAREISVPLAEMRAGAERFARGELDERVPEPAADELGQLARALNAMAVELDNKIHTVLEQRNELDAVLSCMIEGVVALGQDDRMININRAAAELLQVDEGNAQGRQFQQVIRSTSFRAFVDDVRSSPGPLEREISFRREREMMLNLYGRRLLGKAGQVIGILIVLHDVTELRRLEKVRSDFVANVSHELKTPIASIKGFVETLLDGAKTDADKLDRFLGIIARHADRLNAIIEDLLDLSRIEGDAKAGGVELQAVNARRALENAVEICARKAEDRGISIAIACPTELAVRGNQPLLEQAIVNLIDNAIKYSEHGGEVEVSGRSEDGEIVLSVLDRGCGIEREHHSRIFERFYRVDKARSRDLGGTGLGLALVKHIAIVHGGSVTLRSAPGKGSVFSIRLTTSPVVKNLEQAE